MINNISNNFCSFCQKDLPKVDNKESFENDNFFSNENDFENEFHKVVFGSIYKLHMLGAQRITIQNINDFLSTRPVYETLYNNNKGEE